MKIFTIKNVLPCLFFFSCFLVSYKGHAVPISFTGALSSSWNVPGNWSPSIVPTSADAVTIPKGKIVVIDVAIANCASLDFESSSNSFSSLTISGSNTLNIVGNLNITDGKPFNVLAVGAGTLTVGGNVLISGNGADQRGELTLSTGTVNVAGDFGFTFIGAGNFDSRLIDVTETGSITVGGQFTNPGSGTITPGSVDNIYINASYFRTTSSGSWNTLSIWQISWDNITFFTANIVPAGAALKIQIMPNHIVTNMPNLNLSRSVATLEVMGLGSLDCGLNQVSGSGAFNLNANATLITSHASGIGSGGSIAVTGTKTFSSGANYEFSGASTGTFTTTLPAQSCNNLTTNNATGVNLSMPFTVNGTLNITGKFNIGSNILALNGNLSGTNALSGLVGSATSELVIGGPSVNLNLGFNQANASARTLRNYTQTRNALVTLTDNMLITGVLKLSGTSSIFESGTNGYLRLVSTATSFANVDQLPTGSSITGIVNVESWFTGGPKSNSVSNNANRGTRILSSPVRDNNSSKSVYMGLKDDLIITGTGSGFNYTGAATLLTYNEPAKYASGAAAQYFPVTDISSTAARLRQGEGFFLFYRGDNINNIATKITPVGGVFATPESFAITYKGEINQGPITIGLSHTGENTATADLAYNGFNLIGNPYPATIDWAKVTRSDNTKIDNMVSIIKPGGGMITYSGGVVINGTSGALPGGATAPATISGTVPFYIQPGQGFYVRARAPGQTITFTETSKAVYSNGSTLSLPARLLSTPSATIGGKLNTISGPVAYTVSENVLKAIYLELSDAFNKEETAIVFKDGNDAAFGADDATYFSSSTISLSTLTSDSKSMAINFMPDLKDVKEIKLSVNVSVSGQVKLNFKDLKAAACYQVFLRDALFPDALIDVKSKSVYEFSIDKSRPATYGMERISIFFKPEPVEPPVSFTAEKIKSGVELSWLSEKANDIQYFEVETSPDGILFNKTAEVRFASANMAYSFIDKAPAIGVNYYRIKQVNKNGHYAYTSIKSINFSTVTLLAKQLIVYPNPSTEYIQVQLTVRPKSVIESVIYDLAGKKMMRISFKEDEQLKLDISQLKSGFYILRLTDEATQKIIGKTKFRVGL